MERKRFSVLFFIKRSKLLKNGEAPVRVRGKSTACCPRVPNADDPHSHYTIAYFAPNKNKKVYRNERCTFFYFMQTRWLN